MPSETLTAQVQLVFDAWRVTVADRPGGFAHEDGVRFMSAMKALAAEHDAKIREQEAEIARLRAERNQAYRMISGIDAALNGSQVPTGCHSQTSMGAAELNERTREAEAERDTLKAEVKALRQALVDVADYLDDQHTSGRLSDARAAILIAQARAALDPHQDGRPDR